MKLQKVSFAPIQQGIAASLSPFIADPTHQVAYSSDVGKGFRSIGGITIQVTPNIILKTLPDLRLEKPSDVLSAKGLDAAQHLKLEKAFVTLSNATLPIIKKYCPQISGPIDGIEFLLASKATLDAFADPERKTVLKPMIKVARTLSELVDIVKVAVPSLGKVPYLEAAGVIIKVGDTLIQFYIDFIESTSAPAPKKS
jgi:hypothetical protein